MKKGIIEYCNDKGFNIDEYVDKLKEKMKNLKTDNKDLEKQVQRLYAIMVLDFKGL